MADSHIAGPVDGIGKAVDAVTVTTGDGTVYRETASIGDPSTGAARVAVKGATPATTDYGLVVRLAPGSTSTVTKVTVSTGTGTLLAANPDRRSVVILNDTLLSTLMVKEGTAAGADDFSHKVLPGAAITIDGYTGVLTGLWDIADASGKARITERVS